MVNLNVLAAMTPFGAGVKALSDRRKQERFQDQIDQSDQSDQSDLEFYNDISMPVLIVLVLVIIAIAILMCVCLYNILPNDFMKPLHILLFIFFTPFYMICLMIYIGLIDPHVLTEKKPNKYKY